MSIIQLTISIILLQGLNFLRALPQSSSLPLWLAKLENVGFNINEPLVPLAWTVMFVLLGVAFYFVWKTKFDTDVSKIAVAVFFFQSTLSLMWSYFLFSIQDATLALVCSLVWLVLTILNTYYFYRVSVIAGNLLVPFLIFVSYLVYTSYWIWQVA